MTDETSPVKRSRLNYGFDRTTPAYVIETGDSQYICRGLKANASFGSNMQMSLHDVELLTEVEEEELEEYRGEQIAEYKEGNWSQAELRLEIAVESDHVDARIFEYEGPRSLEVSGTENSEVEEIVEEAMESLPGEFGF